MKVLILLFSIFNFFNNDFNKKEINLKGKFEIIENIEIAYDDYYVIENGNKIEILYNSNRILLINNVFCYRVTYDNEVLTIFYKNNKNDYIKVYKYNKGKQVVNKQINNKFIDEFDVIYYRNTYILVTSVEEYEDEIISLEHNSKDYLQNMNAIIVQLNQDINIISCKIYGGKLNDRFEKIYYDYNNDLIYITGKKDQFSGFDFGNGGNGKVGYILCAVNDRLDIVDYRIFENQIKNLEISKNIKIYTNFDFFVLNADLSVISSLIFDSESVFSMAMDKWWVATFTRRELKIYDFNKNCIIQIYEYKDIYEVDEVRIIDDKLILLSKENILKGFFYNDIFSDSYFVYDDLQVDKLNTTIYGIPKNKEIKSITYEEGFDPLIYGDYELYFNYDEFTIISKIRVLERSNVTEGYIYPIGYCLFFSGVAYLNGEEIFNNHELTEAGEYNLVLEGKDNQQTINFKVCEMDVFYHDESLKNWDYEIRVNQELNIIFSYEEGTIVKKLFINGEEYEFTDDVEKNKITLSIAKQEPGTYDYMINKIIYEKNDKVCEHLINYYFKVKVVENKISLNNSFYNTDEYFVFHTNIINNNNQVRMIKIETDTTYTYIPLKKGSISINDILDGEQKLKIYLVYDVLGKLYEEQLLFELEYNFDKSKDIGNMDLIFNDNKLSDIIINIPNDEKVKLITVDNEVKYQSYNSNNYIFIIFSVIFVLFLFIGAKIYKTIKKKTKNEI